MGEVEDDWCHLACMEFFWPRFTTKEGTQNIRFIRGLLLLIGLIMLYMVATETGTNQSTSIQF
jgi:Na+/melibiose symporter-like transporter